MIVRSIVLCCVAFSSLFVLNKPESTPVNTPEKETAIIDAVIKYLEVLHFSPKSIDDNFSETVFDNYIENVDRNKRFLLQPEVNQLNKYRSQIDDQILGRKLDFFDSSISIINHAVSRAKSVFYEVIECDLNFDKLEAYETDPDKLKFSSTEEELKDHWRKTIKLDILNKIDEELEDQEKDTTNAEKLTISQIKENALDEVKENYERWFERIDKVRRSDRFEVYVNTITHVFDPHSDYYNFKEKEDFNIRMGGKLEGIGARLTEDGEFIKIVSIIPGGPAWKGKELEVNDLIVSVAQEGEQPVSIIGMRVDDAVTMIRGAKGTNVTLKVKKTDGTYEDIMITRDEVIIDEGFAKSLKVGVSNKVDNIGLINLPKFYSSFEGKKGNSCAVDVAKEIEKLKAENVNGIILDLRNNGGGSLADVITMAGLFIEDGPIVQVKSKDKSPRVYEDDDDTVLYDGPLLILVNEFSASASEIMAAAMQDYNRAVVVGSTNTFGKGTVQRFQNLDQFINGLEDLKPLGEIKLTNQKFFRINGGSTQLKGVTPDIVLPDTYNYISTGEKEYDHALPWTQIDAVKYKQNVYQVKNKENIISASASRINDHEAFQTIETYAQKMKDYKEQTSVTLNIDAYRAFLDKRELEAKQYEAIVEKEIPHLTIENLTADKPALDADESKQARNEDWISTTQKDLYLEEALYIMQDMISQ